METIQELPKEAWLLLGTFIGALFALFGTWLQNRAATSRLDKQLANDNRVREEERKMAMRREIYYGVIDSLSVHIQAISGIIDTDITKLSSTLGPELNAKNIRLQLVAGKDILLSFFECGQLLGQAYANLMPLKIRLNRLEISQKSESDLFNLALNQSKEFNHKIENCSNKEGLEIYSREQERLSAVMSAHIAKGEELTERIYSTKLELMRSLMPLVEKINGALGDLMRAIRTELLSAVDPEMDKLLNQLTDRSIAASKGIVTEILNHVEKAKAEMDSEA